MATVELTSFHYHYHHKCYRLKSRHHIHIRLLVNIGLIRQRTSAAAPVEEQITQKRNNVKGALKVALEQHGMPVDSNAYVSRLQVCTDMRELKQIHGHMLICGLQQDILLGTKLVTMYVTCGSLADARLVFDKMEERNIFLWNAMIRGYASNGFCKETIGLYYQMQEAGTRPNNFTFPFVLKACAGLSALQEGREIQYQIVKTGFESDVFVRVALIDMYSKCGSVEDAWQVFDKMSKRIDVVLWNAMIAGFEQNGRASEALTLFRQMQMANVTPTPITMVSALSSCTVLGALKQGKCIHDYIIRSGFESNVFVGTALIDMYAKCWSVENARHVFDKMPQRNVVSWTAMIAGYAQNGHANDSLALFHHMQLAGVKPNPLTMVAVLSACAHLGALQRGKRAHNYIIRNSFESNVFVGTALIDMYSKCGSVENAREVFNKMSQRSVVSWNAMIAGCAHNGYADEALALFTRMQLAGIKPNSVTMLSVLSACACLEDIQQCKWIHDYIIRSGLEADVSVGNSLVAVYAKCGSVDVARQLFDKLYKRDVVSWTAMIAGYAQNGQANEALTLFHQMQLANVKPDSVTMVSVLMACGHLGALQQGKWIHDYVIASGFESDVSVGNSLIAMYTKCGNVEIARQLFDKMPERDVVSWTAMIAGYAQNGYANEALMLFHQMQLANVKPDSVTMVSTLSACAHLAALQQGKWMHDYIIRNGLESDVSVGSALVSMYAKCGSMEIARRLFDKMSERDVVSWNAMIAGYGMHGRGEDALALFLQMQQLGMKPDHVTFVCVLSACSHAGLVDEGLQYFGLMSRDYCLTPRVEHYACMVDLLGRAGCLDEAQNFIEKMPLEPDVGVWGSLLGACRIHCNIDLGERVAERLFNLDPKNAGYYVLLSNIYAAAGRWDDVAKVRILMKERELKKTPGCSLIEVNKRVHAFLVGDRSHPQSEKIYATLDNLAGQMEEAGYVANMNFVLHDVEEEVKGHILSSHSEKLAIAFGLINTSPGTPIRITKNLRVCGDCHSATKFISNIVKREIIVRDSNRFHHFKDGLCSCGDYW